MIMLLQPMANPNPSQSLSLGRRHEHSSKQLPASNPDRPFAPKSLSFEIGRPSCHTGLSAHGPRAPSICSTSETGFRSVRVKAHRAAERVDLANDLPLRPGPQLQDCTTSARSCPNFGSTSASGTRAGRTPALLRSRMATADNDYVVMGR